MTEPGSNSIMEVGELRHLTTQIYQHSLNAVRENVRPLQKVASRCSIERWSLFLAKDTNGFYKAAGFRHEKQGLGLGVECIH